MSLRTSSDRACLGNQREEKEEEEEEDREGEEKGVKEKMVTTTSSEEMGQQGTTKSFRGSFWVSRVVVSFCGACFDKKTEW